MKKRILIICIAILVIIQFIHPARNNSGVSTYDIKTKYPMPSEVATLFENACYNCHSNKTEYPWYSKIQPVDWWLTHHIVEAKRALNFSEFTKRRIAFQNHKLEEVIENIDDHKMPLPSYTWFGLHPEAKLTQEQREVMINWAKVMMDTLAANYPADSLKMRRKQ